MYYMMHKEEIICFIEMDFDSKSSAVSLKEGKAEVCERSSEIGTDNRGITS